MFSYSTLDYAKFVYDPAICDFIATTNDGQNVDLRQVASAEETVAYQLPAPVYQQVSM
ncbi:hypothetical protein [Weissella confusa]|jgi:hypothetical protein|uniref:Uncharacterized protein n=3 Tax=Weissella confusa TaxID=1583 RepID=A0A1T4J8L8_WEICO|nr:hypothetical protein [Weissella confusa]COI88982.1 Uncharacterised protein [Streptococcus pneumoniae]MBF7058515.1 hypothetical protein [Weissella confusa]MBJ7615546.1 hypothetical protein [Weissella confusa]MBJ7618670.1 hypothetical protein [Weissella confusa]MBJ7621187.1 hypothetical protein [Weissella confusa]